MIVITHNRKLFVHKLGAPLKKGPLRYIVCLEIIRYDLGDFSDAKMYHNSSRDPTVSMSLMAVQLRKAGSAKKITVV
jgi:hypothetical protein